MTTCVTCGCAGHGQTWMVPCVQCGKEKFPTALDKPVRYVCGLCRLDSPRQAAGWRTAEARRVKAAAGGSMSRGGTIEAEPPSTPIGRQ